jgi:hypothetical protein
MDKWQLWNMLLAFTTITFLGVLVLIAWTALYYFLQRPNTNCEKIWKILGVSTLLFFCILLGFIQVLVAAA